MRLFELADNPYNFDILVDLAHYSEYCFETKNNLKYKITFRGRDADVVIDFYIENGDPNNKYGVQNTGDQFKVFSTIKSIFAYYINKHKTKNIRFSASRGERSRIKLYDALAIFIEKNFPYTRMEPSPISFGVTYEFSRISNQ